MPNPSTRRAQGGRSAPLAGLFVLGLIGLSAPSARAFQLGDQVSVAVTDDFELRYYTDDTPASERLGETLYGADGAPWEGDLFNYGEQVNRLNTLIGWSSFQLGVQVDEVTLFDNTYYLNDEIQREYDLFAGSVDSPFEDTYVTLEKIWLTQRWDKVSLQLGDSYTSFGRGVALNMVRNTDIDIDTSLLGARVAVNAGDWAVTAVSGLTNQQQVQQDNPNRLLRADLRHMVSGARVERFGMGPLNLGAHGVTYAFAREPVAWGESWSQYGAGLDAVVSGVTAELLGVAGLDWYLEGDLFSYNEDAQELFGAEEITPGVGAYGAATAYPGRVILQVEGRYNRNTERLNTFAAPENYELATGPTLEYERVITEDSAAAVNSNDIVGGRIQADIMAGMYTTPRASIAVFRDNDITGLHFNDVPETIVHPVVGVDYLGEKVQVIANAGYRIDKRDTVDGALGGADQLAHTDVALHFPMGPLKADMVMDAWYFQWGENANQQADFVTETVSFSVTTHGRWSVNLYQDFTNDDLVTSSGNLTESLYGAAEFQVKPTAATTIKAFYGAYRAGIRCSGGQCRRLPGFDGARLSMVTNF